MLDMIKLKIEEQKAALRELSKDQANETACEVTSELIVCLEMAVANMEWLRDFGPTY